jgi:hypothetical protein
LNLSTRDVDRYECDDGDDADPAEEKDASPANVGSMQNVVV